jgi:integrase
LAERRSQRKSPRGKKTRARNPKPKRPHRERYDKNSYRHAIAVACARAGIKPWGPNRLRHSAGTEIRRQFGLEAAQVILGHARADVTQVYAETNVAAAMEVMRRIG